MRLSREEKEIFVWNDFLRVKNAQEKIYLHKMKYRLPNKISDGLFRRTGRCELCGKYVDLILNYEAGGVEIPGEALFRRCEMASPQLVLPGFEVA